MTPAQRIAQQTWRWCDGETATVLAWLRAAGMTVRCLDARAGDWAIDGLLGVTVGLSYPPSDPVGVAVCLGMAWCGPWWPQVMPGMLDEVTREWGRRRRQAKEQQHAHD